MTVWTPHISNSDHGSVTSTQCNTSLVTSIFPERDRSCHLMLQASSATASQCRTPLDYRKNRSIPGLMTLHTFLHGGHEIANGRIMLCVKSIGPRKKHTSSTRGTVNECVHVGVFDDTSEGMLSLWNAASGSALTWKPSRTILLLTNASCKEDGKKWISLSPASMADVDPNVPDAHWLRAYAQRMVKREHVNLPFPDKGAATATLIAHGLF